MSDKLEEIRERRKAECAMWLACPTDDAEMSIFQCGRCRTEVISRGRPATCAHCETSPPAPTDIDYLLGEVERYRRMVRYAFDAPDDPKVIKSILWDALHGCAGASNVEEVRESFGSYESRAALSGKTGKE